MILRRKRRLRFPRTRLPPRLCLILLLLLITILTITILSSKPPQPPLPPPKISAAYILQPYQCPPSKLHTLFKPPLPPLTPYTQTSPKLVSLKHPPLPIINIPLNTTTVTAKDFAWFYSHVRLWRHVFYKQHDITLILSSSSRYNPSLEFLTESLRAIVHKLDEDAVRRREAWHVLFVRHSNDRGRGIKVIRYAGDEMEEDWFMYVVSREGVNFLLAHLVSYEEGLRESFGRWARGVVGDDGVEEKLVAFILGVRGVEKLGSDRCGDRDEGRRAPSKLQSSYNQNSSHKA